MRIGSPAPDFSLPDMVGQLHRLSDYRGQVVVINFWSAECPWCGRADLSLLALQRQASEAVVLLNVASNVNEPDELITGAAQARGLGPVLRDRDCELANVWEAQTTPHIFIVDRAGILRYRGALDDVTFRKRSPDHHYVEQALAALLAGHLPDLPETPYYGCAIVRSI
ncbi:MAG TPA: redoxin domain-containing protein [Anaerolineales bacterium]|jgi:peroxiredoxin